MTTTARQYLPPYLVQRFLTPHSVERVPAETAKLFLTKNPITREQSQQINNLLRCDYMGSSEYEFGAIATALREIASSPEAFKRVSFDITGRPEKRWSDDPDGPEKTIAVFGVVPNHHEDAYVSDFKKLAADSQAYRCQERACVREGLFGRMKELLRKNKQRRSPRRWEVEPSNIEAWLELEALWFFTRNKELADATAEFLGVPHGN